MKHFIKILSLMLCLMMLLSVLTACNIGEPGEKGEKGEQGLQGADGKDGRDGRDGLSPTLTISDDGYWVINGVKTNVKAEGTTGDAGRGIEKLEWINGELIVTYTDGTTQNLGSLTKEDENNNGEGTIPSTTLTWTDIEDVIIYIAHPITLRNSPSDSDKSGITLNLGDSVLLLEKSNKEWYKVSYAENTYYIYSYVTVTNGASVRFNNLTDPVYSSVVNLNTSGSAESMYYFRYTPCYDTTGKYLTQLNELNIYKALTKTDTSDNKLQVLALSEDSVWARVLYTPDENTEEILYIKTAYLEAYKVPEAPGTGGGVNPA